MVSGKDESADPSQPLPASEGAERAETGGAQPESGTSGESEFGPAVADFGAPVTGFGPPVTGPSAETIFGAPVSEFGAPAGADPATAFDVAPSDPTTKFDVAPSDPTAVFGTPVASGDDTVFGAPAAEFGAATTEFGPPTGEYAPVFGTAPDSGAAGWTPAPAPAAPDLAWRPADGSPPTAAVPPEYRAPDSSVAPGEQWYAQSSDAQYDNDFGGSPEETVRHPLADPPARKASGWATGGGIKTAHSGRESAWLRNADAGMPPAGTESRAPQQESLAWADDPIGKLLTPKKPAPQQESLAWSDDPIAKRLAPKPAATPKDAERKDVPWARISTIVGGVLAVLVVAGLVVVAVTRGGGEDNEPLAAPSTTAAATTTATASTPALPGAPVTVPAAPSCASKREGPLSIGNGTGGTSTGLDAILGFQHAFYIDRDGAKARSFVAADAPNVSPAEVIQTAGIDPTPVGTMHCLRVFAMGPDAYVVDLTEYRPDGATNVYQQYVTTVTRNGKHLIYAIDQR
ncbi:hypothetical protein [Nocardia sp. NPDC057668]|uniref:hypothetical protein n=1 Tax=Nocardia sp. NPDC057668 TaxID=3346202 RepID=UPI00366CB7BD